MSGHSKWSKVKHQKAVTDAVKGQAFTKAAHAITTAVREGGGVTDPNFNFRLRLAIENARAVNTPKENITRAVERGSGEGASAVETVIYEGYGPSGVAFIVEAATDNRQRTVSLIKNVFDRYGGTLASPGAVNYLFKEVGIITVAKNNLTLDQILAAALDSGAEDVIEKADVYEIYTTPQDLHKVQEKLTGQGIVLDNTALIMHPTTTVTLTEDKEVPVGHLVDSLEELEDVQAVYTNLA